jgi:hypothetical protein
MACATCRTKADDFRAYAWYGFYAHQPDKMERKHAQPNWRD